MNNLHRRVTLEVLELYKGFRFLWDRRKVLFNNKHEKKKAFKVLCEKYRQIQSDITVPVMRKKIFNLRGGFIKEHKKVLVSRMKRENPVYTPTLFYYESMLFLEEVLDFRDVTPDTLTSAPVRLNVGLLGSTTQGNSVFLPDYENDDENENGNYNEIENDSDNDNENDSVATYVEDEDIEREIKRKIDKTLIVKDKNQSEIKTQYRNTTNAKECESFGTTVGHQLQELDNMQRVFAEKLIADVIFYGRLQKLSGASSVHLN